MAIVLFNKIGMILEDRGLEQKDLVEKTGLTPTTISELVRNKRTAINREHIGKVAGALGITDPSDIFYFAISTELPPEEGRCLYCQQPVLPEFKLCTNCDLENS